MTILPSPNINGVYPNIGKCFTINIGFCLGEIHMMFTTPFPSLGNGWLGIMFLMQQG
jgi:hypothetical protein